MCGIAGIIGGTGDVRAVCGRMCVALAHRGPEDEGVWQSAKGACYLGHRRLKIIDLSPLGHQPMVSKDGRYAITFNGEIYNYRALRSELAAIGHTFVSESDTEVLLAAFAAWGKGCLHKLHGMFAFAVWDEERQELFAARDRLGEKPFKYWQNGNQFVFASELKAILEYPGAVREVDWQAVDLALTYRYVPAPRTGFAGIHKLPPGHCLTFAHGTLTIAPYWQAGDFAHEDARRTFGEWKESLWGAFVDSVRERMVSDVPFGAFLSGGLDSSSVVAAMSEAGGTVRTFSVGFKNHPESETEYAHEVARHFGTDHTDLQIDPSVMEGIPALVRQYEEPFFDNAAVPTLAMAEITKRHVTVVLTGDGGDELFGGYPNHVFYDRLTRYQSLPAAIYKHCIPALLHAAAAVLPFRALRKQWYRAEMLSFSEHQAYADYCGIWQAAFPRSRFYLTKDDLYTERMKSAVDGGEAARLMGDWLGTTGDALTRSMHADIVSRLPEDYLVKIDYAGMRHALEARTPFLDHRLVELALAVPSRYKVRDGEGKWIWKQIMQGKLPERILSRRKMGFGIPIRDWMRHELHEHLRERLLAPQMLHDHCNRAVIERLIADHRSGAADYSNHLWSLLLLAEWLDQFFGA